MGGSDMDALKDVCHRSHVGSDDTVAILAQGASWAVAVTQAFLFLRILTCGVVNGMNNNARPFAIRCVTHQPQPEAMQQPRRKPSRTTRA